MKNKINSWVLVLGLGVLSLSAFGQRDTIKFYPFMLHAQIKDSNAYPIGLSKDSFVITHRPELDTIYKLYKVYKLDLQAPLPDPKCNNNNYRLYKILCRGNEYLLLDTLRKFNSYYKYDFMCISCLIQRASNDVQDQIEIENFKIYPNPITDFLTIENNNPGNYNLQLFKINGQAVYTFNNITSNTFKLDANSWENGVYYILITSKNESIVKKIIKN